MRHYKHSRLAGLIVALLPACSPQDEVNAVETSTDGTTSSAATTSTGPTGTTTTTAATSTGGATTTTTAASTGATGNTSTASNTSSGGTAGTTSTAPTSTGGSASTGTTTSDAPTSATSGVSPDTGTSGTESVATDTSAGETSEPVVDGIDPATFAPDLDGFYWEGTCIGTGGDGRQCAVDSGFDPANVGGCTVNLDKSMTINGDAGTKYIMEVEVRGLLGSRCYTGGTRRAGDEPVNWTGPNDGLYIGGTVPSNWWNSYEVHVMGGAQGEPDTMYLNSYFDNPSSSISFNSMTCTMEEILEVNYKFEVAVMGNSSLLFRINDQNCQAQMNCGAYNGVKECPTPRTVDLVGMNPPATFEQPPINAVGANLFYPQWAYFDVKSVRVAE